MKPLRYDPRAREEFIEALRWYAERNEQAAEHFFSIILHTESAIQDSPQRWPFVPKIPKHLEVRRLVLHDFPYSMVYVELDGEILVIAIAHAKRRPGYWRNRVPSSS